MVRWESELIPILSQAKAQLAGGQEAAIELPSGYGVADLVFFDLDKTVLKERVREGIAPIDQATLLHVLIELQHFRKNQSVSITMLRKKAPLLKNSAITYLIDNNFLIPVGNDKLNRQFKKGNNYKNGLGEVVAIEAKLKDWKRGMFQAYRYRSYADKSFLAVYTKSINAPLKNISQFKKFNVGLIEVGDDFVKVHYRPKKEQQSDQFIKAIAYENLLSLQEDLFPDVKKVPGLISI